MKIPTIDWKSADYRLKWWWNGKGQLSIEMKIPTTDWKWNCRSCLHDYPILYIITCLSVGLLIGNERPSRTSLWSKGLLKMLYSFRAWGSCWLVSFLCCQGHWNYRSCLSDHLTICLSIWLSNENVDYQLENAVPVYRTIWLSVCLSDYRLNWKLPINDWNCRSCLPFFMSYRKLPTNDWNCRSCLPFMSVLPFLSTVEVLDACVNQYQYWSGKERSRGKDVLTFQTQFARLRDQSTMHFIRYTVSLFCCGVSWQTKPSRTMASISNSVHLDCSWETSYSQPFVPTWSAVLHVPQGNAAGQCYHLFFNIV